MHDRPTRHRAGGAASPTSPVGVLDHEHQVVLLVLGAAERDARRMREGGRVEPDRLRKMLGFLRDFVDRCHHTKEEKFLFPMLRACQPRDGGNLVEKLLGQHEQGRRLLRAIDAAARGAAQGGPDGARGLGAALDEYVRLLRAHIDLERTALWPLAERCLGPHDRKSLVAAFDKIEAQEMGLGAHEQLHQLAHELAKE